MGHPASADPFLPVPPASFLNYHVGSADQLAQEVALDAVVRVRLARHFHQTEPEVSRYIHDNLVLTHLTKPGQYRVACVTPSGREFYLTQHLAAGTGVFVLRGTGRPILKQACGNPMVAVLPAVAPKKVVSPQIAAAPKNAPVQPVVAAVLPSDVVFTNTPPLEATQAGGIGPFVKVAGITQSLGHSSGVGFFPAVLGAAGLGLFGGHHGSSGPTAAPTTPTLPAPPLPVVPVGSPQPVPAAPTTPIGAPPSAPVPVTPVTPTVPVPVTPTVPVTLPPPTAPIPVTPTTPIVPPGQAPPTDTPPVFAPPTDTPPFAPPPLTPPVTTPPFIGPPPVTPPSQAAVPEPAPVLIFGLGGIALCLLRLRARRRASD